MPDIKKEGLWMSQREKYHIGIHSPIFRAEKDL